MEYFFFLIEAFFLGMFQGIIEFFPISSSGHLILWKTFFPFHNFSNTLQDHLFNALVQMSSGAALLLYFLTSGHDKDTLVSYKSPLFFPTLSFLSCLPVGLLGTLFHASIKRYCYNPVVICLMLILFGIFFLFVERRYFAYYSAASFSTKSYLIVGAVQALALLPGVSRSGITISVARSLGLCQKDSVSFSFLLAPTLLLAASSYDIFKTLYTCSALSSFESNIHYPYLFVGMTSAFLSSYFCARPLLRLLTYVGLTPFGWYRILVGAIALIALLLLY